jgi:hypothetical protein
MNIQIPARLASSTRYAHIWLPGYLRDRWLRRKRPPIQRVWVLFADHYEPQWARADRDRALARVRTWSRRWPEIADQYRDSAGRSAQYTFFYPQEEYRPELLDPLAEMTRASIGDVEVHIHHDGEGEQDFVDRIGSFIDTLHHRHGLLRKQNGRLTFGFIHGNWALDNSGYDGRWCGLNNELLLLNQLGCYADFTFPADSHPSQPRLVNTIYWATDDPEKPKSYDTGIPVLPGDASSGDLLMVPGPLAINWHGGRLLPRIEIGELADHNPVTSQRVKVWLEAAPSIGNDVFLKLFAHGAKEHNADALLGRDLPFALAELDQLSREKGFQLCFVTAWEMRKAIEAVRCGESPLSAIDTKQRTY